MMKGKRKTCLSVKSRHRRLKKDRARRNSKAHFQRNRRIQQRKIEAAKVKGVMDTLLSAATLGIAIATFVKTF